jgi:hypothetical protein
LYAVNLTISKVRINTLGLIKQELMIKSQHI